MGENAHVLKISQENFVATWNKLDISPNPYGHLGPCDNQILIPKKKIHLINSFIFIYFDHQDPGDQNSVVKSTQPRFVKF